MTHTIPFNSPEYANAGRFEIDSEWRDLTENSQETPYTRLYSAIIVLAVQDLRGSREIANDCIKVDREDQISALEYLWSKECKVHCEIVGLDYEYFTDLLKKEIPDDLKEFLQGRLNSILKSTA